VDVTSMYHVSVCLRDHRRTEVARYRYQSAQAAVRGRLEQLEAWVRVAQLRVLVSSPIQGAAS